MKILGLGKRDVWISCDCGAQNRSRNKVEQSLCRECREWIPVAELISVYKPRLNEAPIGKRSHKKQEWLSPEENYAKGRVILERLTHGKKALRIS